jgi:Dyp-type peroxidase family
MNMNIEKEDVQGIITKGYSELPACTFLLLVIKDPSAARLWLKNITPAVTHSNIKHPQAALNIAFTFEGLKVLGLSKDSLDSFPLELEDGMTTPHKQLFLGDFDESAPASWEWGGNQNESIHILVMLYAATDSELQKISASHRRQFDQHGLAEIKELPTAVLSKRKEHFGFHDGISQPTIAGLDRKDIPENTVATGEFIMGYKNSYGQYPASPMVSENIGDCQQLQITSEPGKRDLGRNGSYLVFRQMEQDVELFWKYMDKSTTHDGKCDAPEMIKLAAKMVGRWPSGAPVTICPDEDKQDMENMNNFDYRTHDAIGLKCPVGSHIRRTNPRDMLDTDRKTSIDVTNKHRLLRRGRSYGKPVCESLDPQDILKQKNILDKRGLYFICVNADIGRQFEFVQNAWVNNPKFLSLYDERDPVIGNNLHPEYPEKTGVFSIPTGSMRDRHSDIPRFTTVKGGAYFFLPGIKALRYLSSI